MSELTETLRRIAYKVRSYDPKFDGEVSGEDAFYAAQHMLSQAIDDVLQARKSGE